MTGVIKHALRASAGMFGSFRPEGWNPKLQVTLLGPAPGGAELVWSVAKPDGNPWFEHRVDAPELGEGEMTTIDLQRWEDGGDLDEAGRVAFTLRLVSDLDGIDELLHDGSLDVVALEGEHRYAIDADWLATTGLLCLDTVDEHDGPKLKVTAFLKGEVDAHQVEAHCFHEGTRFAQASDISRGTSFTANDGAPVGAELIAEFDTVRGWNNLTEQGWGDDDWHLLDANDGAYEVKFVRDKKVTRVIAFEVAGGRLVSTGVVELDRWSGPTLVVDATVQGDLDGDLGGAGEPWYGDAATAAHPVDVDAIYEHRNEPAAAPEGSALDAGDEEGLQRWFDRAERLVNTWADTFEDGSTGPWDFGEVLQAESMVSELEGVQDLRLAAEAVPDDHAVELNGQATTVGELHRRVLQLAEVAQSRIDATSGAAEDVLTPYRELLANDKLAVFEDHPAPDFLYYTTNKEVIESPEELYEADEWYFEGTSTTRGTATVDGTEVDVEVEGWRVLGWSFDDDGNTVHEWETQGSGTSAPKSAFTPQGA